MARNKWFSRIVLYPISIVYGAVVFVRNKLFDWGILKQHTFDIPIIVVGNISAGGTGKTPHVEYIVEKLSNDYNVGVLSRGYKRTSKGFLLAERNSNPLEIGDEPFQIYHKFMRRIPVAVCENRVKGIEELRKRCPKVNLIVLDDAFQHRYVKPWISIVVTEFNRPVFNDRLLPYGRLRESSSALQRADMVIVSKCKNEMKACDYMIFRENLHLLHYQKTYFSKFAYQQLRPVFPKVAPAIAPRLDLLSDHDMVLTVAGIGNPKPFVKFIKSFKARVWVNVFSDHHNFDDEDMQLIEKRFKAMTGVNNFIITTEKDAVRIANCKSYPKSLKPYTYYLPVSVEFLRDDSQLFIADLKKALKQHIL